MEKEIIDLVGDVPPLREIRPVDANALVVAESRRIQHFYVLRPGEQLTDLLCPDAWANCAYKLHRFDILEVVPHDASWHAQLLVVKVGPEFAEAVILHRIDLPTVPLTTDDIPLGMSVYFLGNKRLWACLQGEHILRHGFATKDAAIEWIIGNYRS